MSKKNISVTIALLLLLTFLITGCGPTSGGGNNVIVPIIVTFDPQGGTVDPVTKKIEIGAPYGELPTPIRAGFIFVGWYTEKTDGDRITKDTEVIIDKNHTLYARWISNIFFGNTVTVTFDPQGGKPTPIPKTFTVGSAYGILPIVSKTMHSFKGWYTEPTGGIRVGYPTIVSITNNHTLYAQWDPLALQKTVTVTFDPQGGTVALTSKDVPVNSTYGFLPTPTRWNHGFLGWYTTPTGAFGTRVTEDSTVTLTYNHTLYALWNYFGPDLSAPTIADYTAGHKWGMETSTTITVPNGTQNGDLLILIFNIYSSKIPDRPAGWSTLSSGINKEDPRFVHSQAIFYRKLTGAISNFTVSHSPNFSSWILLRIPDGDIPIASSVATGRNWYPDPPALTHNFAKGTDVLWIAVAGWSNTSDNSVNQWPAGYNDNHICEVGVHYPNTAISTRNTTENPQNPGHYEIEGHSYEPPWCACTIAVKRQ